MQKASYNSTGKPVTTTRVNVDEAAKTRIALGLQYLKLGEMSNAKFNLEKALTFSPKLPAAHAAMAYYYQTVDELELAEKSFVKALSYNPNDPDTLNNYGAFLCRVKRFDEAEKTFMKAIKVPSYLKVAESYENAALCALENNQFEKAKSYFASSLDHSALRANTLINMASLNYAMGEFREAQKYAQRLSNIGVVSPRVLLLRALVELKLGNVTQSKKHGTTLVSMYVKSPEALMYLSRNFDDSEFEQLRRVYLKNRYEKYKTQLQQEKRLASTEGKAKVKLKPKNMSNTPVDSDKAKAVIPNDTIVAGADQQTAPSEPVQPPENTQTDAQSQSTGQMVSLITGKAVDNNVATTKPPQADEVEHQTTAVVTQSPPQTQPVVEDSAIEDSQVQAPAAQEQGATVEISSDVVKALSAKREVPFHIIQAGEFLYDVSVKYNIRIRSLMEWNDIDDQNQIKVGQKIYLDHPLVYHKIREGDTLFKISQKYRIAMEKLLQWNKLTLDSRLTLGQKILVVDPEQLTL